MVDTTPTPTPEPAPPLTRRTQFVLAGLLLALVGLLGWHWYTAHYSARPTEQHRESTHRIDLNNASRAELSLLPHLGPKKADSIVAHRQMHGSFQNIDDLRQVQGIGNATVDKLRPWLALTEPDDAPDDVERLMRAPPKSNPKSKPLPPGTRININTATLAELDTLPNIGPVIAQRIIDERAKKPFTSIADLRRVSGIGAKRLEALQALVTVE
jgi:competence protein ComEA